MKKIYTTPRLRVVEVNCDDIVTASTVDGLPYAGEDSGDGVANGRRRSSIWDYEDED